MSTPSIFSQLKENLSPELGQCLRETQTVEAIYENLKYDPQKLVNFVYLKKEQLFQILLWK